MKRQRRTIGAVLRVPLNDEMYCYALMLPDAEFAFFGPRFREPMKDLSKVLSTPVLFRAAVNHSAWKQGRWLKIGKVSVPEDLLVPRPMFIQTSAVRFQIYRGGVITNATREQCEGLESCVAWRPENIEERLNARFDGLQCDLETKYRLSSS